MLDDSVTRLQGLRVEAAASRVGETDRRTILRDVDLEIFAGQSVGIAGESGSGKSTLVQAMFGYTRPGLQLTHGTLTYGSKPPVSFPTRRRVDSFGAGMALVPQSARSVLDPIMPIGRQLTEVLGSRRARGHDRFSTAVERLAEVGFPEPQRLMHRYPHELSGGQRQRIAIALALATQPRLLVLDEATTDLDVVTQHVITSLVLRLQREHDFAIVAVSHDLRVLDRLCDQLLILYRGQIVESGRTASLLTQPQHPYTARLVHRYEAGPLADDQSPRSVPRSAGSGCDYRPHCDRAGDACLTGPDLGPREPVGEIRCWDPIPVGARLRQPPMARPRPETEGQSILTVDGIVASYRSSRRSPTDGAPVLKGLTLNLRRGECLALIGESGSGKSTLGRVVMGLHPPSHGQIVFDGTPLAAAAVRRPVEVRRSLQVVQQNPESAFNPARTIKEALLRRVRLFEGLDTPAALVRIAELLEDVSLQPTYLDRRPSQLSGGEKQRLAIARALIGDPTVLICDEIVSSLDVETQASVLQLLQRLQVQRHLAYLFISHDLSVVADIAHRVAVLRHGVLEEVGETGQVLEAPKAAYTRSLVSASLGQFDSTP